MQTSQDVSEVLEAMAAVEPKAAAQALDRLIEDLRTHGADGADPDQMWASFRRVLRKRGYFVSTPAELEASLAEILALGEGFDLFDLARGLAEYDALRMEQGGLCGYRVLPELEPFALPHDPRHH